MPFVWEDNALFLSHKGVNVYHLYKNDFESSGTRDYWFGLHPYSSDDDTEDVFDVRDLPGWSKRSHEKDHDKVVVAVIMEAIEQGHEAFEVTEQ